MSRVNFVMWNCIAKITGQPPDSEEVRIRTMTLLGQVLVFRVACGGAAFHRVESHGTARDFSVAIRPKRSVSFDDEQQARFIGIAALISKFISSSVTQIGTAGAARGN